VLKGATSYLARRKDGSTFPIEVHAAPLDWEGRRGLFGVIRDITSRRKMEERLERLERSNLVTRLASGIAHDFNNLLAVIQSNTEVAQKESGNRTVLEALQRIRAAVQRGSEKVGHIRQMGTTREGGDEMRPLYLNPLVEEVLELTRARWADEAQANGVAYEVDWQPGLPAPTLASPSDLRAALVALVFNAIEAMPRGGRITLRTFADPDGNSVVTVRDEGEGIAPQDLPKLTDAFFTTRSDRQMGLGLHLVQQVLQRHEGRLEVDSDLGRGSAFALVLPRSAEAPSEPPPPPRDDIGKPRGEATVPERERPKTRGGRSVLLIDDQADLLQVVRTILEGKGFSVDTALSGREGVAMAEKTKYSAVLTDLGMPDITGWEVTQRVREQQPDTPVVLMTGWAADIDAERLKEHRVDALLAKPFRTDQLLATVQQVLEKKKPGKRERAKEKQDSGD
jgi:signal transduction histidine kinase/ActR/RegA family two-component response regulator